MNKKSTSSFLILVVGFLAVIIMIVCAHYKDEIVYKYYEKNTYKQYSITETNEYFLEDNFNYVENYTETNLKSKEDMINFIYYTLNSGNNHLERFIDKDYKTFNNDIQILSNNDNKNFKELISTLNNFVHPYNSSSDIKISYGSSYTMGITINKVYTEEKIEEINKVVDKVIEEKIQNNTPVSEKIKIIHDYIIDNTEYDKLKYDNRNDTTYESNNAYGVLIQGYGTCNGYADAMAIFLNKLNIINYKISNDEHIWNLVYKDGKWYHLDLTWDDPISDKNVNRDTYFLITTKELEQLNDNTHNFNKVIYSEAA